ncbi:unnamed protein product [Nippostrongylus brasiliensis]|uniref:Transmembrane protein n=1 Tax=Nippostrongylus brasiliensis TaxID=27835 RepID=A0A0N4XTL4_NIPBR|nr:unnamed protein product [Nippostrongylus brasiliensis]
MIFSDSFQSSAFESKTKLEIVERGGLSGTVEVVLLALDFLTVLFLFLGLSKNRSGLMKPYMFFNSVWTLCLCLLLVICLWKIIKGSDLPNNILANLNNLQSDIVEDDEHHPQLRSTHQVSSGVSFLVTAAVMLGLVVIIIVDSIFVHIVYRTFTWIAYMEDKAKEDANSQQPTTNL